MKITNRTVEVLIGAFVLILVIKFIFIIQNSDRFSTNTNKEYILYASFDRVDGVNIGTPVSISGVKVGQVINQVLDNQTYNAVLTLAINKDINLPVDTLAEIISSSLLGEKYVSLVPGADSDMLKNNDKIEFTQSSISFESLISRMLFGMESGKNKESSLRNENSEDSVIENNTDKKEDEDEKGEHLSFSGANMG
ncbi:outer membrane lipid asymmetry maintenance protein MlaD [Lyticum sinuosum]|uniref:MlaD superfamily outer membrane lipid asymmetry maintenance protein n=1 Tax=Lyticum sinuosum TaxID=1332059 RepID=A0AAE4VLK8_9RICK|nr:outer membrane lipid asymmetry maintenance protein MlaD [Lyticum sinuosum]MDZ5761527.1 putative MlaD superfamily outer membrane lipid asymmetry maintenance protein [Lyticum sinuosum]